MNKSQGDGHEKKKKEEKDKVVYRMNPEGPSSAAHSEASHPNLTLQVNNAHQSDRHAHSQRRGGGSSLLCEIARQFQPKSFSRPRRFFIRQELQISLESQILEDKLEQFHDQYQSIPWLLMPRCTFVFFISSVERISLAREVNKAQLTSQLIVYLDDRETSRLSI
jgi:hypothetical protein